MIQSKTIILPIKYQFAMTVIARRDWISRIPLMEYFDQIKSAVLDRRYVTVADGKNAFTLNILEKNRSRDPSFTVIYAFMWEWFFWTVCKK